MISLGELRVEATIENLRIIAYFINGIGQRLKLTEKSLFDIELAVEEASANIINHAYPAGYDGDILIVADADDSSLRIMLTDWGIPFRSKNVEPFDINAPVETRIQGGMGLHFIQSLMDKVERNVTPEPGASNTLTLIKHIKTLEPGVQLPSALRERNAMMTISQFMVANIDLDNLLELIVKELVNTIDSERGTLYLIDESTEELVSQVLLEDKGQLQEIRVKIGEGVAGHVAATGRVINIQDAYKDTHFQKAFDEKSGYQSRTILAAPMRNHDQKIIGVVQLINKKGSGFTSRDERLLTAMAAQAAISIENARLYAQEIRQRLIKQEIDTARAIQQGFLPEVIPALDGWQIAAFWKPMREVGGDFYGFHTLSDARLGVIIGDVSGKGIPAAMFMAYSETVLQFAMSLYVSPAAMLTKSNTFMLDNQKSRMFATAFAIFLDVNSGEAQVSSAGHNPPIIYRYETSACDYLVTGGVALGVFDEATYQDDYVTVKSHDVLVLYTDGITEAINEFDEEFSEERLEHVIADNADKSAQAIVDAIMSAVDSFTGQMGLFDDQTLLVLKRT